MKVVLALERLTLFLVQFPLLNVLVETKLVEIEFNPLSYKPISALITTLEIR